MKTNRKSKITPELVQDFIRFYNKNYTLRKISVLKQVSPNTVKKYLMLSNIKVKTLNIVNKLNVDDDFLIGLYVGVWCGDGTQYKDRGRNTIKICCNSNDKDMIKL